MADMRVAITGVVLILALVVSAAMAVGELLATGFRALAAGVGL